MVRFPHWGCVRRNSTSGLQLLPSGGGGSHRRESGDQVIVVSHHRAIRGQCSKDPKRGYGPAHQTRSSRLPSRWPRPTARWPVLHRAVRSSLPSSPAAPAMIDAAGPHPLPCEPPPRPPVTPPRHAGCPASERLRRSLTKETRDTRSPW